jgi:uncharacterized protein (DUF2236 family)
MFRIFYGLKIHLFDKEESNVHLIHSNIVGNAIFNLIGAQPTILMQVADAAGARGLMMHGMGLFDRPVRRFVHTIEFLRAVSSPPLDALEKEGKESDQLRSVLKYYNSIHKNMQPHFIDGVSYGFSKENRFWVWASIIYAEMPARNIFTYPLTDHIKQKLYERMVTIGLKFLETEDHYPALYPDFMNLFDQKIKTMLPCKESLFLTHEMLYPSKGPLGFRLTSRMTSPLAKRILPVHLKKNYGLEANKFEKLVGLLMTMVVRLLLPLLPQFMTDTENLLKAMRFMEPKAGTILNFGRRRENVNGG